MQRIFIFFDRLEDRLRAFLSKRPIVYAIVGAVGIILLWKGVWEMAEVFPWLFGLGSVVVGLLILLATGLLVSFFVGDEILFSGWRQEKKFVEKAEKDLKSEKELLREMQQDIASIKKTLE